MGPRLGRVEYRCGTVARSARTSCFNGATLRTRGIRFAAAIWRTAAFASMGPRLGRVEYPLVFFAECGAIPYASMGPRLGRVEYAP